MKKIKENINNLEIGKTYKTPEGLFITIKNIWISGMAIGKLEAYVEYEYELKDGKKGKETNKAEIVMKNILEIM